MNDILDPNELDLRNRTRTFIKGWRTSLKRWHPDRAGLLYEDLEQLAALAESQHVASISEAALELAVFLSSFVDTDVAPNVAQREGLERLVDRLAALVGAISVRNPHEEHAQHRQAFVLCSEARTVPGFAEQLGQRGWLVRPFRAPDALLQALAEVSPDLLVIDEAFVDKVHPVVAEVQRRRHPHSDPVLCVVLAEQTDIERTQFVLRAGADSVVTERDPIAMVAQLETLLVQRRSLEYRVLVVEDDRSQAKFCEAILRLRGVAVCICDEPTRVLEQIAEFNPDLVLMDLYLAGANGIDIARQIRDRPANAFLPIVFLSGEQAIERRFEAIRAGADDFITKPVKPSHLLASVESRIKRARELRAGRRENRGERRGIFSSREVMAREMLRAAHEGQEHLFAIALITVDSRDDVLRKIGFVNAGVLPQQLAAAIAAELSGSPMLCAWGELHFLALLPATNETDLRRQLEDVRNRLQARTWLSDESPLRLHFSLGCALLPHDLSRVDGLLERVRELSAKAQQLGGSRCEFDFESPKPVAVEDARRRMVRALLQGSTLGSAAQFEFQPLLPVMGLIAGIYEARAALKPPNSSHISPISRSEYLPIANELGLAAQADRQLLHGLLALIRARGAMSAELQLHVPIAVATALEPDFASWLDTERRAIDVPSGVVALQLDASDVRERLARIRSVLPSLQSAGVRLVLDGRADDCATLAPLLDVEDFAFVKFTRPGSGTNSEPNWQACSGMLAKARALGKIAIASDVAGVAELPALVHLGVHYVQGDGLAEWSPKCDFDFPEGLS